MKIEFRSLHKNQLLHGELNVALKQQGDNTENTYLFVTVMAIFAKQYEAILATACVEACPEDIPKSRKGKKGEKN